MAEKELPFVRVTQKAFNTLIATIRTIKKKTDLYPDLTPVLGDGDTYAFRNGALEKVCEDGNDVMMDPKITATSLALQALEDEKLPAGYDEQMYEEIREILGEEIYNEFAANSIQTFPEDVELSDAEKIEAAKADYLERKAERLRQAEESAAMEAELAQQAESLESGSLDVEKGEKDVEQDKTE